MAGKVQAGKYNESVNFNDDSMSSSAQRRIKQAGTLLQRNFDHMDPRLPNNKGMRLVPGEQERTPKYIRPKDRIRQFNLTIGDKVLVTKGNEKIKGRIGTIARMDRTQNICWLAEHEFQVSLHDLFHRRNF